MRGIRRYNYYSDNFFLSNSIVAYFPIILLVFSFYSLLRALDGVRGGAELEELLLG